MSGNVYVAVHGGAGNHSRTTEKEIKQCLRQACMHAISSAQQTENPSSLSVVESAISILEDNPRFNAGYGSNLTLDGHVECDASIMDGRTSDFGSIGAVSGVKNPIRLARYVLEYSRIPDKLGRLAPMTVVSNGARDFVRANFSRADFGVQTIHPDELVAPRARDDWMKWKERLATVSESTHTGDHNQMAGLHDIQDTVGAVAWVEGDGAAAGVSSGGLLLKHSGRIGEAAVYGAGCWAQRGMACSVSGAGEHITRTALARSVGETFMMSEDADSHDILHHTLVEKFWNPCKSRGELNPSAGVILLTKTGSSNSVRLWCAFTTTSMAIAYASSADPIPKALILRRPPELDNELNGKARIFITAITVR
ncbi:asparaginase [Amanita rubescens]|nr:asparaginase [Amanita rubescens]